MAVIQFPSQPPQDGLTDHEVHAVVAWAARASGDLLEVTPVSGSTEGARFVSLLDRNGEAKFCVCRERGRLVILDGYGEAVPRGARAVVESLWQALTGDV